MHHPVVGQRRTGSPGLTAWGSRAWDGSQDCAIFLLTDACANRLAGNDDLYPAVLLPARSRVIAGNRIALTHPHRGDIFRVQSLPYQERSRRIRSLARKCEIKGLVPVVSV